MFTTYEPGVLVPTNFQNGISVSGSQGFCYASSHSTSITLTPAQIFAFRGTQATNIKFIKSVPIEGQGSNGNAIIPVSFTIQRLDGGATAYTNFVSLYLKYAGGDGNNYRVSAIPSAAVQAVLGSTTPTLMSGSFSPIFVDAATGQSYASALAICKNADLEINSAYVDTAFAAGNAPIKITLFYNIVSL